MAKKSQTNADKVARDEVNRLMKEMSVLPAPHPDEVTPSFLNSLSVVSRDYQALCFKENMASMQCLLGPPRLPRDWPQVVPDTTNLSVSAEPQALPVIATDATRLGHDAEARHALLEGTANKVLGKR